MPVAALREAIRDPLADAVERVRALQPGDTFDAAVPAAIVAAGLHRLPVPVDAGGLGASMTESAEVLAALGAVDGSTALGFAMHIHSVGSIAEIGRLAGRRTRLRLPGDRWRRRPVQQCGHRGGRRLAGSRCHSGYQRRARSGGCGWWVAADR